MSEYSRKETCTIRKTQVFYPVRQVRLVNRSF